MKLRIIFLFIALLALIGCDSANLKTKPRNRHTAAKKRKLLKYPKYTNIPEKGIQSKITLWKNIPFVEVYINGSGPFNFGIDTGATGVMISSQLVNKLGLRTSSIATNCILNTPNGKRNLGRAIEIDKISIGGASFQKIHGLRIGSDFFKLQDHSFEGILGLGLFRDTLVEIDYAGGKLRLKNKRDASVAMSKNAIPAVFTKHGILIKGVIGGKTLTFVVDTGNSLGINIAGQYVGHLNLKNEAKIIKLATLKGISEVKAYTLDGNASFGKTVFKEPAIYLQTINLLGGEIFKNSVLVINRHRNYISIEPIAERQNKVEANENNK